MGDPIIVLDHYYLSITFLITLTIQSISFMISYVLQFDKITDFSGGMNFFILSLITFLFSQSFDLSRNWIVSFSTMLWSIRLAGFLLFRVLKRGQDNRFDEMRSQFFKFAGFWTFQLCWVWLVSWPIIILNSPSVSKNHQGIKSFGTASDIIGLIFWSIGLIIESLADVEKFKWKENQKSNGQDGFPVCRNGTWKWSRHPNYFGEILLWWGIWLMTIESAHNEGISKTASNFIYASIISPIFITLLLMFVSGLPTAERPVQEKVYIKSYQNQINSTENHPSNVSLNQPKSNHLTSTSNQDQDHSWDQFKEYLDSTSILFPIPNSVYVRLPRFVKVWVLFDWPIYRFNEAREGQDLIKSFHASHS
ncbi:uncharacterized protein MELLADRAFT_90445 [Melampsora larici-populina 98AG31]|uniref:Uncharacterized protein n=1 Tax=Melampsora larici-populina (strain 98AG31 / pathotype 3-4-7) TaxID=747676 RepID=F4RWZ0_MELLP|nr:uncharacterized protein MELLADRAFT_90445 [Melampsora larici-populina 98AG31]EGG03138.1 hypothetical protein MELLADRAFT_90445 [Melampsora larici-populina 98AG31]